MYKLNFVFSSELVSDFALLLTPEELNGLVHHSRLPRRD
jgi:hypothetical protein